MSSHIWAARWRRVEEVAPGNKQYQDIDVAHSERVTIDRLLLERLLAEAGYKEQREYSDPASTER